MMLPVGGLRALAQFAFWIGQTDVEVNSVAIVMNPPAQVLKIEFTDVRGREQFHLICNQPERAMIGAMYYMAAPDSMEIRSLLFSTVSHGDTE